MQAENTGLAGTKKMMKKCNLKIKVWGKYAETLAEILRKGSKIMAYQGRNCPQSLVNISGYQKQILPLSFLKAGVVH